MSLSDQDAYSIGPYYKAGYLTLLFNRAARFATSWVEIMFFRYISPNLPGQRDPSAIGFSLGHAIKPGYVSVKADCKDDRPLHSLM